MAIFASTTTSGYSDPLKAFNIKALEQRQRDIMAQQAAASAQAFTPENTQTPVQGLAQVANAAVDAMRQRRADEAVAAQRNAFAKNLAGVDWEKGPTSQQIAGMSSDPETLRAVMQTLAQNRREFRGQDVQVRGQDVGAQTAQRGQDVTVRGQDVGAQTAQRGQDVTVRGQDVGAGVAVRGQDVGAQTAQRGQDVTVRGQDVGAQTAQRGQDVTAQTAQRGQDVTVRGQDVVSADTQRGQDVTAQTAQRGQDVTVRGQDVGAQTAQRGQDVTARGQDVVSADTQRGQDVTVRGQDTTAQTAQRGQDVTVRGQDITAQTAEADRTLRQKLQDEHLRFQAEQPGSDIGKIYKDAGVPIPHEMAEKAAAKLTQATPGVVKSQGEALTGYKVSSQALDKLDRANQLLKEGINTGPWAAQKTMIGGALEGRLGTEEANARAQRTNSFNSILNENTIKEMSATLKGQDSNYEMQKFIEINNNPNAKPKDRVLALQRLITSARIDRATHMRALKELGAGDAVKGVDEELARGTGSVTGGGGAGAGGGAGSGDVKSVASEAEAMALPPNTKFKLPDGRTGTAR